MHHWIPDLETIAAMFSKTAEDLGPEQFAFAASQPFQRERLNRLTTGAIELRRVALSLDHFEDVAHGRRCSNSCS